MATAQQVARFAVGDTARVVSRTHGEVVVTVLSVRVMGREVAYVVQLPEGGTRTVSERFLSAA